MMANGLAIRRAATAAQVQAASTSNPTLVHSEDLQPNETLNRRRGVGLPPVVATTTGRLGSQVARRGRRWTGSDVRRPHPIPLPPRLPAQVPSASSELAAGDPSPNEERAKPFSMQLPSLKPKLPLSGLLSTTLVPRPALEHTPSRKRRRIDQTPEFASSNITRDSVITNVSPRSIAHPPSPSLEYPGDDHVPSSPALPSPPPPVRHSSLATPTPASPVPIKREQETPPPLGVQRTAVSSQHQFYPFPDDCNRTNPKWKANRAAYRKEKERELQARGLDIVGRCITRYVLFFQPCPLVLSTSLVEV